MLSSVIIGAGPAGVSAAWALVDRGLPVTMLDAGTAEPTFPAPGDYLALRHADTEQWRWQLGSGFETFDAPMQASPKLRVPGFHGIFADYASVNRLHADPGFHLVGALAAGGLSNAWGCGVSRFDDDELGPLASDAMQQAYARVALRTGLSGASDDALQTYFGLDAWARPPLPLDALHQRLWQHRARIPKDLLRLGRARVAVLNEERDGRQACDLSGTCLWGCERRATWSAALEVAALRRLPGVRYESGVRVEGLRKAESGEGWIVDATTVAGEPRTLRARRILLAAGTLASTRLALAALPAPPPHVRLLSNPMAAFLLVLPAMLGHPRERAFGLAQLSFVLDQLHEDEAAMGNLFSTAGLPVSEFLAHLPITRNAGLPLMRALLPATVVGNVFLPGNLSAHRVSLESDGSLSIHGGHDALAAAALTRARQRITTTFRRLGAWMLPGSFVAGAAGADLHYAGTLPIRAHPEPHECHDSGEIAGLQGVYAIDGASLPMLPAKAHTLTIMANAERIARALAP